MSEKKNWYEIKQNNNIGYALTFLSLKIFPTFLMRLLAFPIGFFYWIFSKNARRVSEKYFENLAAFQNKRIRKCDFSKKTLFHIVSFALNLVEDVQAWAGKVNFQKVFWRDDDVNDLVKNIDSSKGVLLIISHVGNAQMLKALASAGESGTKRKMSITTITDQNISAGFNKLLKEINSDSAFNIVSASDIGVETLFMLQDRLEKGEVVVIAGDRVSAKTNRNIEVDFLGKKAPLPYGVFLLASLLNVPTYFVNGVRRKDFSLKGEYDMFVKKNEISFDCSKKEREERISECASSYAKILESLCEAHPYQWYNFFDFWS